jgi:protein PET100
MIFAFFSDFRFHNPNMGGWQLEAAKMGLYMVFPVGCFYYFNQAEFFEDWMINLRREMYPAESRVNKKLFEQTIREMNEKREREYLRLLEEKEQKNNV